MRRPGAVAFGEILAHQLVEESVRTRRALSAQWAQGLTETLYELCQYSAEQYGFEVYFGVIENQGGEFRAWKVTVEEVES